VANWAWGPSVAIDIKGNTAYIGNGYSFQILDISNLSAPVIVGEYATDQLISDVRLQGDSVAFVCNWAGLSIFNVSHPSTPVKLSEIALWGCNRVIPTDSFAYVASGGLMNIIDITDLNNPFIRSQAAGDGGSGAKDQIAFYKGRYVFLGDPDPPSADRIYVYDCSNPDNIQELPSVPTTWGSFAVRDQSDILLVGGTRRIKIYDITNPSASSLIAIDSLGTGYPMVDAITVSDYNTDYPYDVAFAVSESKWLYTIDIAAYRQPHVMDSIPAVINGSYAGVNLPLLAQGIVGMATYGAVFLVDSHDPYNLQAKSVFVTGGNGPMDIALKGHFAYLADGIGGLSILDITDPTHPTRVGSMLFDGGTATAITVKDSYAYIGGGSGMRIVDISNPTVPIQIGMASTTTPIGIRVEGNTAYVAIYKSAVVVFDVSNPGSPLRIATIPASVYHVDVIDSLLYMACIDSMVVMNVKDPHHPSRITKTDIYTESIVTDSLYTYTGGWGLTIFNFTSPDSIRVISSSNGAETEFLAKSGKYVFLSQTGGIVAYDVGNPVTPQVVGSYYPNSGDYIGIAADDRYIYSCELNAGLKIFENKLVSQQQTYSFNPGWNMVSVSSFPPGVSAESKDSLFPFSSSGAFAYRAGYVEADTIERGLGYWLKFDSSRTMAITAQTVYADTISVGSGWNMIGSISIPVPVSRIGSIPGSIVTSQFFTLSGTGGYQIADTIWPGKGYWVRLNGPASLIMPVEVLSGRETTTNRIRIVATSERPPSIPNSERTALAKQNPKHFALGQNYPNPFNPSTRISYSIPHTSDVSLIVYDLLGREVARLVQGTKPPGDYSVTWNATNVPSGVYYYRLAVGSFVETKKMVVMK